MFIILRLKNTKYYNFNSLIKKKFVITARDILKIFSLLDLNSFFSMFKYFIKLNYKRRKN